MPSRTIKRVLSGSFEETPVRNHIFTFSIGEWLTPGIGQGFGSEAVPARRLIIHVLHCLASQGWHLHTSCDLSKKQYDKDSLLFRAGPPVQRVFFSIRQVWSFNSPDGH